MEKSFEQNNSVINLMSRRLGNLERPTYQVASLDTEKSMFTELLDRGGYPQQDRMIRDKRKSLDKATLYSYQAAWVKLLDNDSEVRALINPNKLKQDYDDKIISIGFEHNFHTGDVFEWCNTNSYWLIYLQDLTELAYFRGDIRRCSYEINWLDDGNELHKTYAALRGPVETKIDYIQKHSISIDRPNFSINFMVPKNTDTLKFFKRYRKLYLKELMEGQENTCWRIEAIDTYSTPNIIEVNAVEYYSNMSEDDLEDGLAGALIEKPVDPNVSEENYEIIGDTFISPKTIYEYKVDLSNGEWQIDSKLPVKYKVKVDDNGKDILRLYWDSSYSGQFDITYINGANEYKKTIVIQSLF